VEEWIPKGLVELLRLTIVVWGLKLCFAFWSWREVQVLELEREGGDGTRLLLGLWEEGRPEVILDE